MRGAPAGRPARRWTAALLAGLLALPASAADGPRDFIATVEARLRAARALPDAPAREAACRTLLAEAFDAQALAQAAAGALWDRLDAPRRTAMVAATARRLGRECPALLARPDTAAPEVLRERPATDGLRIVTRLARADGSSMVLVWAIAPGGPLGWRMSDLVADGIGTAATLRSEFEALLTMRDGNAGAAIADLAAGGRR